jgi:hypothetical protein
MIGNPRKVLLPDRVCPVTTPDSPTKQIASARRHPRASTQFNQRYVRSIFWMETVFAAFAGGLAALTALSPNWIEQFFGADPDHHSGSTEWRVLIICVCSAVLLAALARRTWSRYLAAA